MQDYRKLVVWQKAHQLALETYANSACFQQPPAWPLRDQVFGPPSRFHRTSPRAPGGAPNPISGGFSGSPWVRATNLSMIFFSRGTSDSCPLPGTPRLRATWKRSGVC
jgi:hypothetical protein